EVRVSAELMEFIAHLVNLFKRIWKDGPEALNCSGAEANDTFVERFSFLATSTLQSIDAFCLGDRQLSVNEEDDAVPLSTPSSRSGNSQPIGFPPILLLFRLFLKPYKGAEVNERYCSTAKAILKICCDANDSRRKKLAILSSCITSPAWPADQTVDERIWQAISELACDSLPPVQRDKGISTPVAPTWEFRDAVKILEYGIR